MINRAKMPRQLRGKGGITNVVPRTNYLFGGIKDRVRKLIPNELADVAVKAAPFVAPFSPKTAALMRGIGRFDQRGSISDALKQGAATFAFGSGARKLGGAENVFGDFGFSSPLNPERTQAIGSLFDAQASDSTLKSKSLEKKGILAATRDLAKVGLKKLPDQIVGQLAAGTVTAGASLLASYFQGDFREQEPGETMEDYLAARKVSVGKQMRTYMDNYFASDPEYSALDDAGRDAFVARYNVRDGGRIGYQTGGISSANTLAENIRRNVANQAAFQQSLAPTRENIRNQIASQSARSIAKNITASPKTTVGRYPKFLQMTPSNISQARSLTYPQAFALESQYKFDPKYVGADKTSRLGYFKQGLQSLAGIQQPGSNVGGATPLTRKLALDVGEKVLPTIAKGVTALTSLPASTALMTLNPTTANVDEANMTIEDFQNLYDSPEEQAAREADKARQAATPTPDAGTGGQPNYDNSSKIYDMIGGEELYKSPDGYEIKNKDGQFTALGGKGESLEDFLSRGGITEGSLLNYQRPTMADVAGPATQDTIPGFTKVEGGYQGPDGQIYGAETYASIAAGMYPDIYNPNRPTMADVAGPNTSLLKGPENLKNYPGATDRIEVWNPIEKTWTSIGMDSPENRAIAASRRADIAAKLGGEQGRKYLEQYADEQKEGESKLITSADYPENYKGAMLFNQGGKVKLMGGAMPMGIMRTNKAGVMERDYRDKGGFVPVGIKEKADDVPAMLSKNEFVMTANAVRGAGNGSIEKGAQRMYDTMKRLEKRVR